MMSANSRIRFGLQIVFVCLCITPSHYHHCANFIWRHWTYKMPVRYNLSSVWVRLSIFSQLFIIQYVGLCVFSLPISFVMIERIYIICLIIIIKLEVWTITHCIGLGHEIRSHNDIANAEAARPKDGGSGWREYRAALIFISWLSIKLTLKSEIRNHLFNRCTYKKKINTWETNRWQGNRSIQLGIRMSTQTCMYTQTRHMYS